MIIARRTFLLGLGATIALPAVTKLAAATGQSMDGISIAPLDKRFKFRAIADMTFSSMGDPPSDASVKYEFMRNDECIMQMMMNSRALYRWVGVPGAEFYFTNRDLLSLKVEPCQTNCVLNIISNMERDPNKRAKYFSENFHWKDGKLILTDIAACSYEDQHLLET